MIFFIAHQCPLFGKYGKQFKNRKCKIKFDWSIIGEPLVEIEKQNHLSLAPSYFKNFNAIMSPGHRKETQTCQNKVAVMR